MTNQNYTKIAILRHGKKAAPEGAKFKPGSEFDKNHVHLTPEGKAELAELGKNIFGKQNYYDRLFSHFCRDLAATL